MLLWKIAFEKKKDQSEPILQVKCVECSATKKFPARKGHTLFSERPENIQGI